jgi:hypothetical protein
MLKYISGHGQDCNYVPGAGIFVNIFPELGSFDKNPIYLTDKYWAGDPIGSRAICSTCGIYPRYRRIGMSIHGRNFSFEPLKTLPNRLDTHFDHGFYIFAV